MEGSVPSNRRRSWLVRRAPPPSRSPLSPERPSPCPASGHRSLPEGGAGQRTAHAAGHVVAAGVARPGAGCAPALAASLLGSPFFLDSVPASSSLPESRLGTLFEEVSMQSIVRAECSVDEPHIPIPPRRKPNDVCVQGISRYLPWVSPVVSVVQGMTSSSATSIYSLFANRWTGPVQVLTCIILRRFRDPAIYSPLLGPLRVPTVGSCQWQLVNFRRRSRAIESGRERSRGGG